MRERFGDPFPADLDAARADEGWAFERLHGWLCRPVAAHLRGVGIEDPDGSANEVFLRAFRGLGTFDGDEDRFRSWIFTIARRLLATLVPAQREVVLLRVVADLSIEETARIMGKRPNAIKALHHRALQSLRRQLAEEPEEGAIP